MIKLIVNYSVQVWKNSSVGYIHKPKSRIFTFQDIEEINNQLIEDTLKEIEKNTLTITNMQKI